jgi:hypothetical protein
MGWETRRGRRYYYRSRRVNGRVVKEYVGAGEEAELAARVDADIAEERARNRAAFYELLLREAAYAAILAPLDAACDLVVAAAMTAAGYHKYRGVWRKKRKPREDR